MGLFFAKLAVSIIVVLGLSMLAERAGPRVAGVLSGYPLGTAILLFFIAIEQGVHFAGESAVYALPGLIATLAFLYAYYVVSRLLCRQALVIQVPLSSLASFLVFVFVSWLSQMVSFTVLSASLALIVAMVVAIFLFRSIENVGISQRLRITRKIVAVRAATAALIVVAISGAAAVIGPRWSGLFAGFPVTLFPMILILHCSYGIGPVHTVIRNFPRGMGALLIYIVSVSYTYPLFGVGVGTLLAFAAATLYLAGYSSVVWWRSKAIARAGG
ncbi:hypothetical protein [Thalassospira mesophila]|uniref:Uncharacterized protein n=1 Tax=Thalassospira mesophila TaxID=1293891 RepID=A0A1Y2KX14_9PROT|nr:hypothetical protein [Thalassospira mesophila]OSQ35632.1 hypothetical protein TMES_20510 [Thalassospira mesophila]